MSNKEVAQLIATCLKQKVNDDSIIDDSGREWWYVSPMFKKDQEHSDMSPRELVGKIRELNLLSIKDIASYSTDVLQSQVRDFIQIKGNREEIIKECLTIK
jgi:hypothetical protein